MKIVLASIAMLFGVGAVVGIVVLDRVGSTEAYVSELVPADVEDRVRRAADDAIESVRSFIDRSDSPGNGGTIVGDAADEGSETSSPPAALAFEISATGGQGVSLREECADAARSDDGLREGEPVSIVLRGVGDCAGWTLVSPDDTAATTWVRDRYLVARSAPGVDPAVTGTPAIAAAPRPPASTPTATPTATLEPSPTPAPVEGPAVWFGELAGEPGDIVSAWIGGAECESTRAYDSDLLLPACPRRLRLQPCGRRRRGVPAERSARRRDGHLAGRRLESAAAALAAPATWSPAGASCAAP